MSKRGDVWLVLAEELAARVLIQCGIVDGLHARLGDRLVVVNLLGKESSERWRGAIEAPVVERQELLPWKPSPGEKAARRVDSWLDARIGFFPNAIRLNERHGLHRDRMAPGHPNRILDSSRAGPLPRHRVVDRAMLRWFLSPRRHVPSALLRRLRDECSLLVLANLQMPGCVPFLAAARRLELPTLGYVASWDHTVGKGVISPYLGRYLVQNTAMQDDLERYHGIEPARVTVTGWPQTDVYHRPRSAAAYHALLARYGLPATRPVVLVTGNTQTNAPYEAQMVARLVAWWEGEARDRFSLLFRPHPRDSSWEERFAAARGLEGAAVQPASFTDLGDLATLLQHVSCVVTNAGTILLDALVNDRPAVCVVYDEGAPPGERWAEKNVGGEHYRELMASPAFALANDFGQVVTGIEQALAAPDALSAARRDVVTEVCGTIDGGAAGRVVEAIAAAAGTTG